MRVKDADGARCTECDTVVSILTERYWGWRKSQYLHESGTGHKMELIVIDWSPK